MSKHLDPSVLRGLQTSREVAGYLREAARFIPQANLTDQLLRATEQEVLAPDVFCVWLSASRSTSTIISGLSQSFSNLIRHNAILDFGKMLLATQWKAAWTDLGGTSGIISLLERISTDEVATLCRALGRAGKLGKGDVELKRDKITELLKGLLPQFYPESPHKSEDRRPLLQFYAALVPSCKSEYVEQILRNGGHPFSTYGCLPSSQIAQYHWPLLRKLALELVEGHENSLWLGADAKKNFFNYHISYLLLHIPQLPSTKGGLSSPMEFSLIILRILASKTEDINIGRRSVIHGILDPLIRRMRRRTIDIDMVQEVIVLALRYFTNHSNACTHDNFVTTQFTSLIIRSWCKDPVNFEAPLCAYFDLMQIDFTGDYASLASFLRNTAKQRRYSLLRLIMLHSTGLKVDINSEDGLKTSPTQLWPRELIQSLPRSDAVGLLRRLAQSNPSCEFLTTTGRRPQSPTILTLVMEPESSYPDPVLLMTKMGNGHEDIMFKGKEMVETSKERAIRSRDHEGRGFFAKSAAFYAIATGSLDAYEGVILWSKRFLRDPLTIRIIFDRDALCTHEGLTLLSGIPKDLEGLRSDGVRDMVLKGNQIIMHLFEMAVTALKEQSFAVRDWRGVLSLFSKVVVKRIQHSWRLKAAMQVESSEMYHILWDSTLEMLLQAESLGLEPGYEALEFDSPFGCLNNQSLNSSQLKHVCASTHKFLDNLATARDHIWRMARPTWHAAAAVLDWPWPRGLSFQCYCHLRGLAEESLPEQYPFILSRAKTILFLDKNPSITTIYPDEEARQAIGSHIDSYGPALEFYVLSYTNKADQATAASAALAHAMELCCNRMTRLEALRYLKPKFQSKRFDRFCSEFDEIKDEKDRHHFPLLPDIHDPLERVEWNPLDKKPEAIVAKRLTPTILDYMLFSNTIWYEGKRGYFPVLEPMTSAVQYLEFWSSSRLRKIGIKDYAIQDASIASAMLFLDARLPGPPQILVSSYPSAQPYRLPSLFLDQDFLDATQDDREPAALSVLELFLRRVSPKLLHALTKGAIKDLAATPKDSPDVSTRQSMAFHLLQLLARSDNPELACDEILDTVLNNPDASSWHRFLLAKNFLQRLPSSSARALLEAFNQGIQQKLREAKKARRQALAQNSAEGKSEEPVIKLTTIKSLAQLFEDTTVIPVAECTSMLVTLFGGAGSLDVRVAVVNSLLSRLSEYKDDPLDPLAEQILSALELAVPVIGSLSERQVMGEKDWIQSEQTGQLPEVYEDGNMKKRPPILDAVYRASCSNHRYGQDIRLALLGRVLLPAIQLSRLHNERWMKLFFKKHFPELDSKPLPVFPVRPSITSDLLEVFIRKAPIMLLEVYQLHILTHIRRPHPIDTIVKAIEGDRSFQTSNAGKHFLNLYDNSDLHCYIYSNLLEERLKKDWVKPKIPDGVGITVTHIQECMFAQAQALLLRPLNSPRRYAWWDNSLYAPTLSDLHQGVPNIAVETWLAHLRPVLLKLIDFVEALRQGRVQLPSSSFSPSSPSALTLFQNFHLPPPSLSSYMSVPHPLPDLTFPRFYAESPCPHLFLATTESEKRRLRAAYACQIVTFVRDLLHDQSKPSHVWMPELKKRLVSWRGRDVDRWPIISLLGDTQRFDCPPASELDEDENRDHKSSNDAGPMDIDLTAEETSGVVDIEIDADATATLRMRSPAEITVRVELADKLLENALLRARHAVGGEELGPPTRLVHGWLAHYNETVREIGWKRLLGEGMKLPE